MKCYGNLKKRNSHLNLNYQFNGDFSPKRKISSNGQFFLKGIEVSNSYPIA